jgi:hypothetical protein
VLVGGAVGIDHDDRAAALQRVAQVPQELAGSLDLMIHVDEQHAVERRVGHLRVVRLAKLQHDIVEPLALDAPPQRLQGLRHDVLRQHPARAADDRRQAHRIIALAGADVGDRHAFLDLGEAHHGLELAGAVAGILVRIARRHDRRDRPLRLREGGRATLAAAGGQQQEREEEGAADHVSALISNPLALSLSKGCPCRTG